MKKILLIDGNNLIFRAFYGTSFRDNIMQTSKGVYTNAVFSLAKIFEKLIKQKEYDYLFVAFDSGKKTFRHEEYDDYKGGRDKTPVELTSQFPLFKRFLDVLKIKYFETEGFEADDIIASVKTAAVSRGYNVSILSADRDLLQLIDDSTRVLFPRKGLSELEEYNNSNFFSKFGYYPNQVIDYKGLAGDSSDNLPGVKGIGEKTAIKLLEEYKTLEGIISHIEELPGKVKEKMLDGKETGIKCKHLATLITDVKLPFYLEDLALKEYDQDELYKFYHELEFNSLIKNSVKVTSKVSDMKFDVIVMEENTDFKPSSLNYLIIDVKDNYYSDPILGLAILSDKVYYFKEDVIKTHQGLKEFLKSDFKKIVFDYKKFLVLLKKFGLELSGVIYDTLLGVYIDDPRKANDDFKKSYDNYLTHDFSYDANLYRDKKTTDLEIQNHIALKTELLKELTSEVMKKVSETNELMKLEVKLSEVLASVELNGLYINQEELKKAQKELSEETKKLEEKIWDLAEEKFNVNSPQQLGEVLFEHLHLPSNKKTKVGYSTSVEVLEKLRKFHPIIDVILDYRQTKKLLSTYVESIEDIMTEGFIHPLYKQALTVTGRLSSVEPNIQNMPIRSEKGKIIRSFFKSRFDDGLIMSCDYSQVELRVLAHLSGDEKMIELFNAGDDFHAETAAIIFHTDIDKVTSDMRRKAKAINFGIVYGMSVWGLMEAAQLDYKEAFEFIDTYFKTFPKVKAFLDKQISDAENKGYTETLFNRRRYIPELKSPNKAFKEFGKRTAMNAPIQGSAADIIKKAMVDLNKKIVNKKSLLIAQVHDELLFDIEKEELEEMKTVVKETMEMAVKLKVKLIANVSYGKSWKEC